MEHAVDAGHRRAQALAIGDVAGRNSDAELGKIVRFFRRARERDDGVTGLDELTRDCPADEARRTGHEVLHVEPL
jgi:hypothetical protein